MSSERTGRALGTLDPVIYFQNASGHILLPPVEIGKGPVEARRLYEQRYRGHGYEWREAGTLAEVDTLQNRMVEQEQRILTHQGQVMDDAREKVRRETSSNLRQRMASGNCSAWEREFIQHWLNLREDKRKQYTQRFTERNMYLWAAAFDSNNKQVEDRIGE